MSAPTRRRAAALLVALVGVALPATAEDRPYLRPMDAPDVSRPAGERNTPPPGPSSNAPRRDAVMREAIPPPVDRGDLAPVMSDDGSGLPYELWRGLDVEKIEGLIASIEIPPRSPALHGLWRRLITASVSPDADTTSGDRFTALRLEALYRSGLAREAQAEIERLPSNTSPLVTIIAARNALALGDPKKACATIQSVRPTGSDIPKRLKGQAILMSGYCSAESGDTASAALAAELAREEGLETSPGLEALDALAISAKPHFSPAKVVTLLDYRIADKAGGLRTSDVLSKGEPALLATLATDPTTPVDLGLPATEAAARLNALAPDMLAAIYRANAASGANDPASHRAALLRDVESASSPADKLRRAAAVVDDARRNGLAFQAMQMLGTDLQQVQPDPALAANAGLAAEIAIVAGQYDVARSWVRSANAGGRLDQWLALADIADPNDPNRGASLVSLEAFASAGRFQPETLHRLATVLEALDYVVPIPLWEAANRTPQPAGGYLPETGVLSELQDAAKKQEFGRTVLLTMKSLGPTGAEGANLIALGDSIRALRRAGLEADARRLGVEALLGTWPR